MNRSKKSIPNRETSRPIGFEGEYANYRSLLAKMDEVESINGKKLLFRQLSGLLARMEHGIWDQDEAESKR